MSYEDLITIKTFLMELENLEEPWPEEIRINLSTIAEDLRGSASALNESNYGTIGMLSQQPAKMATISSMSPAPHLIQDLGWTREDATAIRHRLSAFREDWEAPGMEIYDDV
jgi:hypothetical protein